MQTKILDTHTHTSINDMGKGSWCISKGKNGYKKWCVYVKFFKDWKYVHKNVDSDSIWWGTADDFIIL